MPDAARWTTTICFALITAYAIAALGGWAYRLVNSLGLVRGNEIGILDLLRAHAWLWAPCLATFEIAILVWVQVGAWCLIALAAGAATIWSWSSASTHREADR